MAKFWYKGQVEPGLDSGNDTGTQKFWYQGQPAPQLIAAVSNQYTMTADAVSFALVGIDIDLLRAFTLECDATSFSLTGETVGLARGRSLECDEGTFTLTGQTVAFSRNRAITPIVASFALTGVAIAPLRTYQFLPDAGTFAVTGINVGLFEGFGILPSTATFTVTGQDVEIDSPPYFSTEGLSALPTNRDTLGYIYTNADRQAVALEDGVRVDTTGIVVVHQFQVQSEASTYLEITWKGISTKDTTSNPMYLDLWNADTDAWETLQSNNNTSAGSTVQLKVTRGTSAPDYIDANNRITARVWQEGIV